MSKSLSMLVPVYNVEAYVGTCLESLLSQEVDGLEVIVVNDGSTDASLEVVSDVCAQDGRVSIIDKRNSGYGASLNRALDAAQGTYVGILESDDKLVDGALGRLLKTANDVRADVAKGDFIYWWPTDQARTRRAGEIASDLCTGVVDTSRDLRIYSRKSTIWSGIYRRSLLKSAQIRFLETPGAAFQDTSFNFKVFAASHRSVFVDEPIVCYRQDNAGSSIHSKDKAHAVAAEFDEVDAWLNARGDAQALLDESLVQRFNAYLWNLDRLDDVVGVDFAQAAGAWYAAQEREGRFDPSLWDAWRLANLRALQKDPERYVRLRKRYRGDSSKDKARFALALGGPRMLAKALAERSRRA